MTSTDIYKVPASVYAMIYLRKQCTIPAVVFVMLLAIAFIAGCNDVRWWLIGHMSILVVSPMAVSMAWFIATGRKDLAIRLHPQSIESDGKAITVSFYPFEYDDENLQAIDSVVIDRHNISTIVYGSKYTRISLQQDKPFDFLLIPNEALPQSTIFE